MHHLPITRAIRPYCARKMASRSNDASFVFIAATTSLVTLIAEQRRPAGKCDTLPPKNLLFPSAGAYRTIQPPPAQFSVQSI
jgi:hypothetical protein